MPIVRGLCTLAEARRSIYGDTASTYSTDRDLDIEAYISAATPWIEMGSGPVFAESRTRTFDGGKPVLLLPFRFNTVTSVTVNGVATTAFVADGSDGIIYGGTSTAAVDFAAGTQNVVVVVTVGIATIPPNVNLAVRELVRLWWQNGQQANRFDGPDESTLPMGILGRVKALLSASPNVGGFA